MATGFFPRDISENAFARRSCSNNKTERDCEPLKLSRLKSALENVSVHDPAMHVTRLLSRDEDAWADIGEFT